MGRSSSVDVARCGGPCPATDGIGEGKRKMIEAGSLWALVEKRAAATPDGLIAVDEADRELSFAEFKARSERAAACLLYTSPSPRDHG